ncbi:hypothetical protein BDV93DRAFT_512893 [Ceratobasidium sp. AG-I]|nr:hypothetical protein BDV93DRAFT_512893 [Ceratobasidium sp. AG-I]
MPPKANTSTVLRGKSICHGELCLQSRTDGVVTAEHRRSPERNDNEEWDFHKLWLFNEYHQDNHTYNYIQNIKTGAFLTYNEAASKVIGTTGPPHPGHNKPRAIQLSDEQLWIVDKHDTQGNHTIRNLKTKAFITLQGTTTGGTIKTAHYDNNPRDHYLHLYKMSLNSAEVKTIIATTPHVLPNDKITHYEEDTVYLALSQKTLLDIWRSSGTDKRIWKVDLFDCDDFALTFKTEVAKWGYDNFKAWGFGILCGVTFARNKATGKPGHCFNWTVDKDGKNEFKVLTYFEPQSGKFSPSVCLILASPRGRPTRTSCCAK